MLTFESTSCSLLRKRDAIATKERQGLFGVFLPMYNISEKYFLQTARGELVISI